MTRRGLVVYDESFHIPKHYPFLYARYKNINLHDKSTRIYFESSLSLLRTIISESRLIEQLSEFLKEIDDEHFFSTGFRVLMRDHNYRGHFKSYESAVNKTYRLSLNDDGKYKSIDDWPLPSDWLLHINDLARSTVVCRYADSPEYVCTRLLAKLEEIGYKATFKRLSKSRGYYAYHIDVKIPVEYLSFGTSSVIKGFSSFEIQITTQLQEVLYDLTHTLYEDIRTHKVKMEDDWEWNIDSAIFKAAYISHTLHLLEANIASLRREKEMEKKL